MLKFAVKLTAATVVTILLAAALLARNINDGLGSMNVRNGDWATSLSTGSPDAGIILRATVAIGGLFASTREASVYYRLSDISGEPMRLNCRYRIEGADYDANWWSITAYGWDNYLIPNSHDRYSFNNENVVRNADGSWVIFVDAQEQAGNWLPVGVSGAGADSWLKVVDYDFDLLLRLYTPGHAYLETPETAPLPTVAKEACT